MMYTNQLPAYLSLPFATIPPGVPHCVYPNKREREKRLVKQCFSVVVGLPLLGTDEVICGTGRADWQPGEPRGVPPPSPATTGGEGGDTTRVCPGAAPPQAPGCLAPASAGGTPPRKLCRGSPQAPASVSAVIPKVLHGGNPYWKIS